MLHLHQLISLNEWHACPEAQKNDDTGIAFEDHQIKPVARPTENSNSTIPERPFNPARVFFF